MATIRKIEGERGDKYRVEVRMKGFPPQSARFDRITDAKKWAQDTESAIREGRYFKTAEAQKHTAAEMIEKYIKEVLPKKKTTKDVNLHLNYWKEQIGTYRLSNVTPALLSEVKTRLENTPIIKTRKVSRKKDCEVIETQSKRNPATVNRYLASFRHCLSMAAGEWQWLDENPMKRVNKLKESEGRVRFLDDEERERLLKACQDSSNPFLYTVVVLAASTGMRHGEIMNLSWSDIDFSKRRIILQETKNGERRAVALVGKALELLTELKKQKVRRIDNNLVFPGSHIRNKNHAALRPAFLVALKKANIENFKFHDLRHSAASYLAMNGASLTDIAAVLGHKTLAMVKRYSHLSDSHVSSVVESMNKKIFG
jgi:integrase